jgi:hypothetical protein
MKFHYIERFNSCPTVVEIPTAYLYLIYVAIYRNNRIILPSFTYIVAFIRHCGCNLQRIKQYPKIWYHHSFLLKHHSSLLKFKIRIRQAGQVATSCWNYIISPQNLYHTGFMPTVVYTLDYQHNYSIIWFQEWARERQDYLTCYSYSIFSRVYIHAKAKWIIKLFWDWVTQAI